MKRIISIFLALTLLIGCASVPFAVIASTNSSHPASTDKSAYWDGSEKAISGITIEYHPLGDTANIKTYTVYEISNAQELSYVFNLDTMDNLKIVLKNDIYLNDLSSFDTWSTYGTSLNTWNGQKDTSIERLELDGNGHIIYGMYVSSRAYGGLFSKLETNADDTITDRPFVIRNLGIDYAYIDTTVASAFIGGSGEKYDKTGYGNNFVFENCFVGENVTLKGKAIGGFVGKEWLVMSSMKFKNCYSNVNLVLSTAQSSYKGTFSGDTTNASPFNHRKVEMSNCYSAMNDVMFGRFGPHSSSSAPILDATTNFATVAYKGTLSTPYTTALTPTKMTGMTPLKTMKNLGSAYVTTAKFPQLKIFLEKNGTLDSKINIPLGSNIGHTTITQKLSESTYLEDLSINYGKNLLLGKDNVRIGYYKNDELTKETANASNVQDVVIGEWCKDTATCETQDVDNNVPQTKNYWQVEVTLDVVANDVTKFVFAAHTKNDSLMPKRYTVFASNKKESLYDNPIFTVDDSSKRYADEYDLTQFYIDKTKLKDIKFFAVRIYNTGYEQNGCLIQHMKLLGLFKEQNGYSQVTEKINGTTYLEDLTKNYGANQLEAEGTTVKFAYYKDHTETSEGWDANKVQKEDENGIKIPVKLKDLIIGQWCRSLSSCKTYGVDNSDYEQTQSYWQIKIALPEMIYAPTKFVFVAHTTSNLLMPNHYAFFASDEESTLFNHEIFNVTDTTKRYADEYSLNGKDIDQTQLNGIKYIAIRIYSVGYVHNPNNTVNPTMGSLLQHVKLIGLYGDKGAPIPNENHTAIISEADDYLSSLGENQLSEKIYKADFYANNTLTNIYYSNVGIDKKLYAEHDSSDCIISGISNTAIQTENYLQWSVNLDGRQINPEKLVIMADNCSKLKMSQHYAVYLSESKSNLFNAHNKIIEIKDTSDRYGDEIDLTKLTGVGKTKLRKISHIGIRFYHRGYENDCGCTGQDINLIGLYGGTFEPIYIDYFDSNKEYSDKQFKIDLDDHGENLIGGTEPYLTKRNGTKAKDCDLTGITDGVFTKHYDIDVYRGENDGAYEMIYRLDDNPDTIKQINKFILRSFGSDESYGDEYVLGKYEVYASLSLADLFLEKNRIFDYDYERDGIYRIQTVTLPELKPTYAKYVAVRIINPVSTCVNKSYWYPRISEIAFIGVEVDIPFEETELTGHMPVEAFVTDNKGNKTDITNKLTTEMANKLVDSSTLANVSFDINNDKLDLIYNLCRDFEIKKAMLDAKGNVKYSVYAASNFSGLFKNEAKLSDGAYIGSGKSARYIRFSFDKNQGKSIIVDNVSIIGMANPYIDRYEHVSYSMDPTKIVVFEKANGATKKSELKFIQGDFQRLYDTDILSQTMISGGVQGESTLNIVSDFTALQCVDKITLNFSPNLVRYQPTRVNIYLAQTYDDILNLSASPIYTFNGLPKLGRYYTDIAPTLARYMRIEIVENNYGKGIVNPITNLPDEDFFHGKNMNIALAEIDIMGVRVFGMADKKGRLLSFENAKTGIKWDIVALDENDIAPNVNSSKLVVTDATNAQMASLYSPPYFKIISGKVYSVEFYDYFGNKIDNIGGRSIRINFPVTEETCDISIIGNANNEKRIEFYETAIDADENQKYVYVDELYSPTLKLALLELTDEEDIYWNYVDLSGVLDNSDNTFNDFDSSNDFFEEEASVIKDTDENTEGKEVDAGIVTKYSISYTSPALWLIIITIVQGVLFLAIVGMITYRIAYYKHKTNLKKKVSL